MAKIMKYSILSIRQTKAIISKAYSISAIDRIKYTNKRSFALFLYNYLSANRIIRLILD